MQYDQVFLQEVQAEMKRRGLLFYIYSGCLLSSGGATINILRKLMPMPTWAIYAAIGLLSAGSVLLIIGLHGRQKVIKDLKAKAGDNKK